MLTINLIPGHGITNVKGEIFDPGATNRNGTQEAKGTEILANKLKFKLEFNGFKVNLLNEKNVTAQINFVNSHKCDLAISLHFNAFNEKASGVEVLYSDIAPGYHQSTTLKFANILLNHLVKDTGMINRGVKLINSGVGIIKRPVYPVVLSENGFVDHPTEYLWAKDDNKLEILAESHCKAVCEYFGVEYKIEDKNKKENNNNKKEEDNMVLLDWQKDLGTKAIDILSKKGIITNPEIWKEEKNLESPIPGWLFFEIIKRIVEVEDKK